MYNVRRMPSSARTLPRVVPFWLKVATCAVASKKNDTGSSLKLSRQPRKQSMFLLKCSSAALNHLRYTHLQAALFFSPYTKVCVIIRVFNPSIYLLLSFCFLITRESSLMGYRWEFFEGGFFLARGAVIGSCCSFCLFGVLPSPQLPLRSVCSSFHAGPTFPSPKSLWTYFKAISCRKAHRWILQQLPGEVNWSQEANQPGLKHQPGFVIFFLEA